MSMRSDSSNHNDSQKQKGDDTRNTVQDDHGHCRCRRLSQRSATTALIALFSPIDRCLIDCYGRLWI